MIRRAVLVVALFVPGAAFAQDVFNVNDLALGGRTGLMGGAGVAQGSDEAALWMNPAGLAAIDDVTLSLSLGAYGLSAVRVRGAYRDPAERSGADWVDDGFSSRIEIVPASIGVFFSFG